MISETVTSPLGVYLTPAAAQVLDSVAAAADAARQGTGKLLLIPGHRGCGKTFLLSTIAAQAARGDLRTSFSSIFRESFKPTVAAEDRSDDGLLRSVNERFLEGNLATVIDVLRSYAERTNAPALLLLDDLDHAAGCELALPAIIRELHDLARSGQANVLIVATASPSPWLLNGLRPEAAWRSDWIVFPPLRPFEPHEVEGFCRTIAPPDGLPAQTALDLARATGGIPALVVEELAVMRTSGDLTSSDGAWRYAPQPIDLSDFHRYDQGPQQTDRAQVIIRSWLREQARAQEWPQALEDLLAAGALEGDVFTLEAAHKCLADTDVLPDAWTDFDALAEWIDENLVAATSDEPMTSARILTDETDGPATTGTSRYAFVHKAVREYFFGQSAGRRIERAVVHQRIALYAASLAEFAVDSPTLSRRVSELYETAEDYRSAQIWAARCGMSEDLRFVDASLSALRTLPIDEPLAKKISRLSATAAELGDDAEPVEQTLARWREAKTDAEVAGHSALARNALWHIGRIEIQLGRFDEAWQVANEGWEQHQELRFVALRGDVHFGQQRYLEALDDWQIMLTSLETELSALGAGFLILDDDELMPDAPVEVTAEQGRIFLFWVMVNERIALALRATERVEQARDLLTRVIGVVSRCMGADSPVVHRLQGMLLVPEHDHRIDARSAAGGEIARDRGDGGETASDRGERDRIGGGHTE